MIRRIPIRSGNAMLIGLADDLGLLSGESDIDSSLLDVCREFAFSAEDADEFAHWYLRSEVFSKFLSEGDSDLRKRIAIGKFYDTERQVADVNQRLVDPWSRASLNQAVFKRARALISSVLGRFPWEQFPWACRFGPGASTGLRRRESSHQKKWVSSTHITELALPYHHAFIRWCTLDVPSSVEVHRGNKVTTVPKNYKTDRTIAIEPDWNMFLQLGVGSLIRNRLQRQGLLLPDAQDLNKALARLGSWTGSLATLDLSAASDSVSLSLCEALLPEDWFKVLTDLRSPYGVMPDGTEVPYAKISSMGNGYTFELETLLFWALTLSVCGKGSRERVTVFGDDIICPSERYLDVVEVLNQAGFQVNGDKSFSEGPFRESCGGHYYLGRDVTPFYVRNHLSRMSDLLVLGNHLVRWSSCREARDLGPLRATYNRAKRFVPRSLMGPYGMDGVWWAEWDQCCPRWDRDIQAYRQRTIQLEHRYIDVSDWVGSYFHKLWTHTPEVVASRLSRTTSREKLGRVTVDRDSWFELPVRTA